MPTLSDLKKIIGEEVKRVVRAELRDLILEAVEIASRPEQPSHSFNSTKNTIQEIPVVETKKRQQPVGYSSGNLIQDVLAETAASMTSEDYENIYGSNIKTSLAESYSSLDEKDTIVEDVSPSVGVDLDNLPSFIKNAKAVLDASIAKDRERHAV